MKVEGNGRIETPRVVRKAQTSGGTSTFSVSNSGADAAKVVSGPGPIAALDNILMLQEMDDSLSGPSKGVARGEQLLELLDAVRDGLLTGGIPRTTLNRLANAVGKRHENFADPKLQSVLDEIELRAHVELAKLEVLDKRVA